VSGLTVSALYREAKERLKAGGIEAYGTEARFLVEGVLGVSYQKLLLDGERPVKPPEREHFERALERRLKGYPLQYLLGRWEFYGYPFEVGEGVLIPRADTETLCEAALERLEKLEHPVVIDLCSGSGCLAVTMALECPEAAVYAVEKYEAALGYLRRNAALNNAPVRVMQADVLCGVPLEFTGMADVITCNPPYLTQADMEQLQKEVSYEPETALYGDDDGLLFYREITRQWRKALKPGGMLAFEIGKGQERDVETFLRANGFQNVCTRKDGCGIIRVLTADKP
jgi:release factor glutamine methyltransferase